MLCIDRHFRSRGEETAEGRGASAEGEEASAEGGEPAFTITVEK